MGAKKKNNSDNERLPEPDPELTQYFRKGRVVEGEEKGKKSTKEEGD